MSLSTNAVAAKAKSMYGGRLTEDDYQELLKKRTVGEVAAYLKAETPYKEALGNVRENTIHRGQLEQILRRAGFERTMKLVRYADEKHKLYYRFVLREQEINLILMSLRILNSEMYESFNQEHPQYLSRYISFDYDALINADSFETILAVLDRTGYDKVLKPFKPDGTRQKIDYVACEHALYQYFYQWIFDTIQSCFKGKTRKELVTVFESQIELNNVSKIYRYKRFFHEDAKTIYNSLIQTHQRMSSRFLKTLTQAADDRELLALLASSRYQIFADDADYIFIEYYAERVKYNLSRRYMRFSTHAPMVFTTFYIMQKLEIENLINIIEGVRYGVASESIEKMLIY